MGVGLDTAGVRSGEEFLPVVRRAEMEFEQVDRLAPSREQSLRGQCRQRAVRGSHVLLSLGVVENEPYPRSAIRANADFQIHQPLEGLQVDQQSSRPQPPMGFP